MSDITKLLTEAGFKPSAPHSVKWTRPNKADWVEDDEIRLIPYDHKTHTLATTVLYLHDGDLTPVLLALQGKVALTEEERHAVQWAIGQTFCENMREHPLDDSASTQHEKRATTLRKLLARSTAYVVSLADVEDAFDIYDRDLRDSNSPQSEIQAVEQAQAAIMRWLRLNTKQHHQEGERDG